MKDLLRDIAGTLIGFGIVLVLYWCCRYLGGTP